jgi:beta-glucanase (GH16 family)
MKKHLVLSFLFLSALCSSCKISFGGVSSAGTSSAKEDTSKTPDSSAPSVSSQGGTDSSSTPSVPASSSTDIPASSSSNEVSYVPSGYSLRWSDEFTGSALNSSYWTPMLGNGNDYGIWGWGNNEQEYYKAENATVSDGLLHITAKVENNSVGTTTYRYSSARLRSYGKISTTYGYIEAKIKMPTIRGMWPAFWMLPESAYQSKGWPTSGEIDIMENRGREAYKVGGTTHSATSSYADKYYTNSITLSSSVDNWHVYAVTWTADAITFLADGVAYNTVTKSQWQNDCALYTGSAPFDQPFHILLNLAVGGQYDGGILPPSDFSSAEMSVDYVRIYQK